MADFTLPTGKSIVKVKQGQVKPRRAKKTDNTVVGRMEKVVKTAGENIANSYTKIRQQIGDRPFGTKKISERQQVRRYSLIRDDQQHWQELIKQYKLKDVVEYAQRMERLCAKYPDEANYMNPEPRA